MRAVQAFVDERAAPDILEYKLDIMKAVTELVGEQVCCLLSLVMQICQLFMQESTQTQA